MTKETLNENAELNNRRQIDGVWQSIPIIRLFPSTNPSVGLLTVMICVCISCQSPADICFHRQQSNQHMANKRKPSHFERTQHQQQKQRTLWRGGGAKKRGKGKPKVNRSQRKVIIHSIYANLGQKRHLKILKGAEGAKLGINYWVVSGEKPQSAETTKCSAKFTI